MIVRQSQRDYGNRYVQRLVDHISRRPAEAVHPKLSVGPARDRYEQEADRVAKEVMDTISSSGTEAPQRQELEEEELQAKPLAQRQVPLEGGEVKPAVEQSIQQAQGRGQALPENLRSSCVPPWKGPLAEGAFGADFSGVRVHTGPEADALNDSMNARAFTTGQDIFLESGEYDPGTPEGAGVACSQADPCGAARRSRCAASRGLW